MAGQTGQMDKVKVYRRLGSAICMILANIEGEGRERLDNAIKHLKTETLKVVPLLEKSNYDTYVLIGTYKDGKNQVLLEIRLDPSRLFGFSLSVKPLGMIHCSRGLQEIQDDEYKTCIVKHVKGILYGLLENEVE